jgi:aryl-alcohol dehydrogenase-like predicted oxidoreductase
MAAMVEIDTRELGQSGLQFPRVALGCGNFGGIGSMPQFFGQGLDDAQALELMDAAWELGITHFDTADAYGGGRSERAIGAWIRARGHRPTLTTKTYNPMSAGADHGLAPERISRQLDSSLERLGVESVELYLAHDFDPDVPLSETLGEFDALAAAGKLRAYGVSNFDRPALEAALAAGGPQALQNAHSLLHRDDEDSVLPLCDARGVAYLAFGPLSGGWLTGKYRRGEAYPSGSRMTQRPEPYEPLVEDATFDALEALGAFAQARGTSMAGTALAWLLADDRVTQVVVGPGRPEHLEPVREALTRPLSVEEREQVGGLFSR